MPGNVNVPQEPTARRHRPWVFDASPLIALSKVGLLDLPEKLTIERVVPEAVAEEIRRGRDSDPAKRWLLAGPAVSVQPSPVAPEVKDWDLGADERAAISCALCDPGFEVILDERAGRACARALGVGVVGTLGVLTLAKRAGLIEEVRPAIDGLLGAGYHLSADLVAVVLEEVGEE